MFDLAIFIASFSFILWLSIQIAHNAEIVAHRYGEPYGTLLLTMSAVAVEVIMIVIMMSDGKHPSLARDTIFSAVMVDVAGILGFSALLGGYRHVEQKFNVNSGQSYIMTMIAAIALAMVIPDFLGIYAIKSWMIFCSILLLVMYAGFLSMQTNRHSSYFKYMTDETELLKGGVADSIIKMVIAIILVGVMAEVMSHSLEPVSAMMGLSAGVAGVLVAVASAAPEMLVAIKSSLRNKIQPAINIAFGASLATVLLTIPLSVLISGFMGIDIELGLTNIQIVMLGATLFLAHMAVQDGKTNMLEGSVLFSVFLGFVFMTLFY